MEIRNLDARLSDMLAAPAGESPLRVPIAFWAADEPVEHLWKEIRVALCRVKGNLKHRLLTLFTELPHSEERCVYELPDSAIVGGIIGLSNIHRSSLLREP